MTGSDEGGVEQPATGRGGRTALETRPRRRRLTRPVALISLLLGVLLVLNAKRLTSTRVSLNARAELVDVELADVAFLNELVLQDLELEASGMKVAIPGSESFETDYLAIEDSAATIPRHALAADATLTVRSVTGTDRYSILVMAAAAPIELVLPPASELRTGDGTLLRLPDGGPLTIEVPGGSFVLTGRPLRPMRLLEGAEVRSLGLWRTTLRQGEPVHLSTVKGGNVILEDVGGRHLTLYEGEPLTVESVDGVIRSFILEEGAIRFRIDGEVQGLQSGYTEQARSLMPTWFDRLATSAAFNGILGVLAALGGIGALFHGSPDRDGP